MLKKVVDLTSQDFSKGLNTISNILNLTKDQTPNMMNVKVNFDGSIEKRLGSKIQNSVIITNTGSTGFNKDSGGTLTSGLISWWNLDEASGTRSDAVGTNPLLDGNGTISASGIRNQSALFTSAGSNYLIRETTASLETGDINFTLSSWFYLTSTSTTQKKTIISKRDISQSSDMVLLLHMDGVDGSTTFTDNSLIGRTVTSNGGAQIDTAQSKFGGACGLFNGSTSYLSMADSSDFDFGTGDFTIDFWFRTVSHLGVISFVELGDQSSAGLEVQWNNSDNINVIINGTTYSFNSGGFAPVDGTWYHLAVTRQATSLKVFIDGSQQGTSAVSVENIQISSSSYIGARQGINRFLDGYIDELRILKGSAAYTSNFSVPTSAYSNPVAPTQFEYHLYVNTDNIVTFEVSSSGTAYNGQVRATSFGTVTTATWYNVVAWHNTVNTLNISLNLLQNSSSYAEGVRVGSAPFVLGSISNGISAFMDGRIDATGFWKRLLTDQEISDLYNGGLASAYSIGFNRNPWASFDFGASGNRWLTVCAGTGVFASSNLGVNFTTIGTDRTATYQSLERSKNILIATSDAYDRPVYWTGSGGSFMAMLNASAPLARFCTNFQGFTILLNTASRKRAFYYEDENSHLTGTWSNSFDLPSSADDEITTNFVLRGTLYVSTRYFLYRLTYVGGNPDWSFRKIKDFGFVPRTAKIVTIKDVGEVCMGMSWDLKLRLFDGSDDKIISDNIENDNNLCDFSMDNISFTGSGPVISFAVHDDNDQNYKLCVAIGANSNDTTHFINFNGRTQAFFPYDNMKFNTMVMSESANKTYLMAFDRNGYCHMMDSGNLDGEVTPINDIFDSPLLFEKSPSELSKSQKIDFYLSPTSSGTLKFYDRIDFRNDFKHKRDIILDDTSTKIIIKESVNIPQSQGVYQYRLTSSSNTANPWKLNRTDFFLTGLGIGQNETR